jgi:hypothetical protein
VPSIEQQEQLAPQSSRKGLRGQPRGDGLTFDTEDEIIILPSAEQSLPAQLTLFSPYNAFIHPSS